MSEEQNGRPECYEDRCLISISERCHHSAAQGCAMTGPCRWKMDIPKRKKSGCAIWGAPTLNEEAKRDVPKEQGHS